MGVDICWRFQREEKPGKWINLSSNYKGDRSYLHFAWLGFDVDRERASTSAQFVSTHYADYLMIYRPKMMIYSVNIHTHG